MGQYILSLSTRISKKLCVRQVLIEIALELTSRRLERALLLLFEHYEKALWPFSQIYTKSTPKTYLKS